MTLTAVKLVEEEGYTTQDGNMQTKKTRRGCPGRGERNMPQGWENRKRFPLSNRLQTHFLSSQQAADVSLHGFWQRHLGVGVFYVRFHSQETSFRKHRLLPRPPLQDFLQSHALRVTLSSNTGCSTVTL